MQTSKSHNKTKMQSFRHAEAGFPTPVSHSESRREAKESKRLLICTGVPFSEDEDKHMAEQVRLYRGKKIVCGGTTSQILSREWNEELTVELESMEAGLPPISHLKGVDLVTEGVITLEALTKILREAPQSESRRQGAAWEIYGMIREAEEIDLLVGGRLNPAHRSLIGTGSLANREDLVEQMASILEKQHGKQIRIKRL